MGVQQKKPAGQTFSKTDPCMGKKSEKTILSLPGVPSSVHNLPHHVRFGAWVHSQAEHAASSERGSCSLQKLETFGKYTSCETGSESEHPMVECTPASAHRLSALFYGHV